MSDRLPDPELLQVLRLAIQRHLTDEVAREREVAEARRAEIVPRVRQGIERARAEGACGRAWLFGSYAWGEPGDRSDVDVLVEGSRDSFAVASLVGRACGLDVHVIDMADAPESLKERVLLEGRTL